MKSFEIPTRVVLTDLEFLRSVFSMNTIIKEDNGIIRFIINNNKKDELAFEEWRVNFGYTMMGLPLPKHEEGVSWYCVRKKLERKLQ